jgi:hypothetical protein
VGGKHRLAAGIPRVLGDHRTAEGKRYGRYCRSLLERLPGLPESALPTVQVAGWVVIEIDRLTERLNSAHRRSRQREANRLRRQLMVLRRQLIAAEERLEKLAADAPVNPEQFFASTGGGKGSVT